MEIRVRRDYAVVETNVCGINSKEMRQMHELKVRIKNVLDSHKKDSEKKEYITDEDLHLMWAVLSVFTKEFSSTQTSAFDDLLKEEKLSEVKTVDKPIDDAKFDND